MNGQAQGILNRLRAVAKERGVTTDHALARWTAERFLARLSASEHASRLVLKGAYVFTLWHGDLMRSTLDVDLHGLRNRHGKDLRHPARRRCCVQG